MKIAFYKAEHGTLQDKIIAWWTRPNKLKIFDYKSFSHVEILHSDGRCFSASPRDNGLRWKNIPDIETSGKWKIIDINNQNMEPSIIEENNKNDGKGYDWITIFFGFVIPFDFQDPKKYTCSEYISAKVFNFPKPHRISPNKLYSKIKYLETLSINT